MLHYTVAEIADITGGTLLCGDPGTSVTNLQYDSREVTEGSLFIPIKGANTDPHRFIKDCLQKGAAALTEYDLPEGVTKPCIKVPDTRTALQQIAAHYRHSLNVRLIGVTGSVGKTSTKEMIAAALSQGLNVMKTQGNRNSQIGMPMTMFEILPEHEAAVIEMGMSEFGEMDRLCDIARPSIAVMTNIGVAHIENLGTQENILQEKFKITKHFDENGLLVLNGDDPLLRSLHGKQPFPTVTFGLSEDNDYYADSIRTVGFSTEFLCHHNEKTIPLKIPALGIHSIANALAAFAVGEALGLSDSTISAGLLTYQNAPMRQQIHECGDYLLIDDSYNASPDAMIASLDVLKDIAKGQTIAVLADMLELGEKSAEEHRKVGQHLAAAGINVLLTVGSEAREIASGALTGGCQTVESFDTNEQAYTRLCELLQPDTAILVKGSRGMHTDEIIRRFLADYH